MNTGLGPALVGTSLEEQEEIDRIMIEKVDGTTNEWGYSKSKMGANAILAVSLAAARGGAHSRQIPLYEHLALLAGKPTDAYVTPVPALNIINGGEHAGNLLAF